MSPLTDHKQKENEMAKNTEVDRAQKAADDNLRKNSGRDQATREQAVDIAQRNAKRGR